jgi:branched-chain amino acid transport system substrate-binding protein
MIQRIRSRPARRPSLVLLATALFLAAPLLVGCGTLRPPAAASPGPSTGTPGAAHTLPVGAPIRIGAVFPLGGNAAVLAVPELAGVQIAADLVNADGGIGGRPIQLEVRSLDARADAPAVMEALKRDGIDVVIGAYSSDLSIAASSAADAAGLLYWEAGAVADQLTGRGLPLVFRVGASGANLGANSAAFAATELAPRLGKAAGDLRVAIAAAADTYATSVADAAASTAAAAEVQVVIRRSYSLTLPDWPAVMADLAAARPDAIILASHIPDGIAFRQAMLAAGLKVGALIGSTMAECDPDFAGELGADAIGIFASDRPTAGFKPTALNADAGAAYDRFTAAWAASPLYQGAGRSFESGSEYSSSGSDYGSSDGVANGESKYTISGPDSPTAEANEEALAGFSAGWALFHDTLTPANAAGGLDAASVAAAARALDLPVGALPNGAGLRFSTDPATLGQNDRAAAVIWQWQAVRRYAFVWPASYATGDIAFVPLER